MQINLARKWRSKRFDEMVGQELVIRLVKNSLYRNIVFPVYLLSGTRGCGKTTLGRLFAAAVNCQALEQFQRDPHTPLPCLDCPSCKAMQAGHHPDFIEIDAASHTGVDNVRQIIEAASFIPALGKKKVYLIDEAHMLSKAAFNAFLKILEEPPPTVVFLLATTDAHKILPTVTSRSFQLFFDPIPVATVVSHLAAIAQKEDLTYETAALELIAQETEGSLRDALNLLERVRISSPEVSKKGVLELLGTLDDERLFALYKTVLLGTGQEVLQQCMALGTFNAYGIWKKIGELIRMSLWVKHGVEPLGVPPMIRQVVTSVSIERLMKLFDLCCSYEQAFAKTAFPHQMLEMMLLKMVEHRDIQPPIAKTPTPEPGQEKSDWSSFVREVEQLKDPLVTSIFKQGVVTEQHAHEVVATFSQDLVFFKEWLETTQNIWLPRLQHVFGEGVTLKALFTGPPTKERPVVKPAVVVPLPEPMIAKPVVKKEMKEKVVKLKDPENWPKASLLLNVFPGTLTLKTESS